MVGSAAENYELIAGEEFELTVACPLLRGNQASEWRGDAAGLVFDAGKTTQ